VEPFGYRAIRFLHLGDLRALGAFFSALLASCFSS
jgi:hypothetical protein